MILSLKGFERPQNLCLHRGAAVVDVECVALRAQLLSDERVEGLPAQENRMISFKKRLKMTQRTQSRRKMNKISIKNDQRMH